MKTISFEYKGSLANRVSAAQERRKIEEAVGQRQKVVIDYSGVTSLSGSYADELFGILVKFYGADAVKTSIKVVGARTEVVRAIGLAIQNRMPSPVAA
ncbi:STAS-like domain-containing protein [Halomonas venusta]|uniref:STAS-like domain-containing protein n=1 Tax=Vreelandella venusta TaxID=44935 RepID=UPI00295EC53D|nr:STAS-like domain-containing protein [Halomonas venusta]MDW0359012.1 STAS-like domain-containing protein [Halomonas venusta]